MFKVDNTDTRLTSRDISLVSLLLIHSWQRVLNSPYFMKTPYIVKTRVASNIGQKED